MRMIFKKMNFISVAVLATLFLQANSVEDCPPSTVTYNVYQAFGKDANPGAEAGVFAKAGEVCECDSKKVKELEDRLSMVESLVDILLSGEDNHPSLQERLDYGWDDPDSLRRMQQDLLLDDANAQRSLNEEPTSLEEVESYKACPGIIFEDYSSQEKKWTCFYIVQTHPQNFETALTTCEASHPSHKSQLAFIKTKNAFNAVVTYLRNSLLDEKAVAHVWLGGNYDPEEGGHSMTWHDGEETEDEATWYPHYPYTVQVHGAKYQDWRKLTLFVRGQIDYAGITNRNLNDAFLPLCQYDITI